jgi:alkanesulfonate monooxygenase SsuD/methylene tetrahydromethanopterin reductase-like flavin-dependent oxidoreductase (luciferase family)
VAANLVAANLVVAMKFSTFHSFMLTDAKGVAPDHLLEGQRVGATHHRAIADELALIRAADRLGFDSCWMREHHFTDYGFLPNTMTMAAHAAALTERIRLGTAVITLPLHHPIRVAEEVALVDVLSEGRVDVGIGRGYQSVEFNAFAVPLDEARARTDEAIEVLRALWTQDRVDHHGRFWDFDGVHLQPRPVQRPCPPLYYASVNVDSITHYAAQGIPFIVDSTVRTGRLAELADLWLGVARAHGHATEPADLVAVRYVWVGDNDDDAREYVARAPKVTSLSTDPRLLPRDKDGRIAKGYEYWEKGWHGRDLAYYDHEPDWHDRWVAGGVDRVITQLRALEAMGIGNVCCVFGLETTPTAPDEIERRMQRFATEVMPAFR